MDKIARFSVLVAALLSLFAVLSSSAGAVTWDNSGNTAFNATSGAGTLSATSTSLSFTVTDVRGVTTTPTTGAVATIFDLTTTCTGGQISGQTVGCHCGITFTATSQTGSVTHGSADFTCGLYLGANKTCHLEGQVTGTYTNPSGITAGVLATSTGNLRSTAGTIACLLGNHLAELSPLSIRVTSGTGGAGTLGPIITRTA